MTIFVQGLSFLSHHGIVEEERLAGQWMNADISAELETQASMTDRIEDTVDYVEMAELLVSCSQTHQTYTLERLAEVYCDAVLAQWPSVHSVRVELRKPRPAIPLTVGAVGVALKKGRESQAPAVPSRDV